MTRPVPPPNPPGYYLALYISQFRANLASGNARPFVIPYSVFGAFILPVLYLSIPHRQRPWLYTARWLVALVMAAWNAWVLKSGTSSENMAVSYATGLAMAWGTIWGGGLVLFGDVQGGVARVAIRKGAKNEDEKRKHVDESVEKLPDGYEHYWQPYPEDRPFLERLGWVCALYLSFRGVGFSHAIPPLPHPHPPANTHIPTPLTLSLPTTTKSGYHRSPNLTSFLLNRLLHLTWSYLLLDLWTITARYDPFFVPGPSSPSSLLTTPSLQETLQAPLRSIIHSLYSAAGILSAITNYMTFFQLISVLFWPGYNPLWQYPSISGSIFNILDRGLGGFWGGFWHQSFRLGFTLPTLWLVKKGWLPKQGVLTKTAGMFVAFFLSGLLHACGGVSAIPATTDWRGPVVFFGMQFLGGLVQEGLRMELGGRGRWGKRWGRMGNLVFVLGWLHVTNGWLIEDISRSGIWLYEPVPFSVLRWFWFGPEGESVWRWREQSVPGWNWGKRWWESGIRL